MTARDTMASALRSTGLYTLNGKTLVDQELLAYCAALDTLYERLEVCKQDSFIGTASETGLLRWFRDDGGDRIVLQNVRDRSAGVRLRAISNPDTEY